MTQPNPFLDTYTKPLTPARGWLLLLLAPLVVFRLCIMLVMFGLWSAYYVALHDKDGDPTRARFRRYHEVVKASQWGARRASLPRSEMSVC